jgi:hypothetical protein
LFTFNNILLSAPRTPTNDLFTKSFPTQIISPVPCFLHAQLIVLHFNTLTTERTVQNMKILIIHLSTACCYFLCCPKIIFNA